MLLSIAFDTYRRDYIVFKQQSKKTEESHLLAMRSLISFLGDMNIEDMTFQNIRDWKEHLDSRMTSNSSRLYVMKLRNVLKFMNIRGVKCVSSDEIAVAKRQDTTIEFLTSEEVSQLIATIQTTKGYTRVNRARDVAIISLLYASGVRVSELCRMNRNDIKDETFTTVGKGNKLRLCFCDERSQILVNEYISLRSDHNAALFVCDQTGLRITPGMVQYMFRTASAHFGKNVHPHTMRHSFATNMLRNNTNLFYVSKFLGHASTQTTEMYTHYVDEDLRRLYAEKHTI